VFEGVHDKRLPELRDKSYERSIATSLTW